MKSTIVKSVILTFVIGALFCLVGPQAAKAGTGATHYAAGLKLYNQGRYSVAIGNFMISHNKGYYPCFNKYYIGFCYYQMKKYKLAKKWMYAARAALRSFLPKARGPYIKWTNDCLSMLNVYIPKVEEAIAS